MTQRSISRSIYGNSSTVSANNMSTTLDSLQKMNLGKSPRNPQTPFQTIDEEGYTTVEYAKPAKNSAKKAPTKPGPKAPASSITFADNLPKRSGERNADARPMRTISKNTLSPPQEHRNQPGAPIGANRSGTNALNSSNWRQSNVNVPKDDNRQVYPKHFFRPGTIIRGGLHEDELKGANSTYTTNTKVLIKGKHGNIYSAVRKMIVVACFSNNYIAVPLYTHNGRGLLNKNTEEYVSVRDHRDRSTGFQALSEHGALITESLRDEITLYDHKSTAHVTYPLSRKYDLPVVDEGLLNENSVKHLVKLYDYYAPKVAKLASSERKPKHR